MSGLLGYGCLRPAISAYFFILLRTEILSSRHSSSSKNRSAMSTQYGTSHNGVPSWESFEAGGDDDVLDTSEVS